MAIESIITKFRNSDPNPEWWMKHVPKPSPWTDANIMRFLRLYFKYSNLWDRDHRLYHNELVRMKTYRNIAKKMKLQNFDEKECLKLIQLLKKRYLREKKIRRSSCDPRPVWFDLIDKLIERVMHPPEKEEPSSESFQACKDCCGKQRLKPPCGYYEAFQECKECCAKQNLKAPCVYFESSESSHDSLRSCRVCCAKQNLDPPCEHLTADPGKDGDQGEVICECEEVDGAAEKKKSNEQYKCYTVAEGGAKAVLINFEGPEDSSDSECFCLDSSSDGSSDSSGSGHGQPCSCSNSNSSTASKVNQDNVYCFPDCLTLLTSLLNTADATDDAKEEQSSESTSVCDEKCGCASETEKTGLFMDSSRFRGKPINLLDNYKRDDFYGTREIVEPRRHLARFRRAGPIYPLQLDL